MTSAPSPGTHPLGSIPIRVITLNIRYATRTPAPGEEPWSVRCPRLCAQLKFITSGHGSAFVCLQEALHSQLVDIQTRLGPMWSYTGHGRDDGKRAGEYSPIFFRVDRWECNRSRTYWLSETPDLPSKGWDADCRRIATVGAFLHRETGAAVVLISTHLDNRGEVARKESARLLLNLTSTWSGLCIPLFLAGDFNSTPSGSAYKILASPSSGMRDISKLVAETAKYGNPDITFTSFGQPDEQPGRIDFLFVRNSESLKFLTFGILPNRFDDQVYLSDHRPVVADIELPVPRVPRRRSPL
ncbi:DNase I-like protein [Trichocladium antarcticum]|uniref:DNase I-like protein n=1 Tax=Trichocladium antarcticum TaxID=1450529 RepID=A0AAN6UTW9_9PEZI|nr:DNase I-like protein [Trichocladium antarcticum]